MFNDIYETMLGLRIPEAQVPGIDDAFQVGGFCGERYSEMRAAYERVCARLGCEEDGDLDRMVDALEAIQRELCERMYRLGQKEQ